MASREQSLGKVKLGNGWFIEEEVVLNVEIWRSVIQDGHDFERVNVVFRYVFLCLLLEY